jgi:adenylate cyclase
MRLATGRGFVVTGLHTRQRMPRQRLCVELMACPALRHPARHRHSGNTESAMTESTAMAVEIERTFLLANDSWRQLSTGCQRLTDGLVAASDDHKVRIRQYGNLRATITVKSKKSGIVRAEFEYEIPFGDAEDMLAHHCRPVVLQKTRHYVPHGGFTWEIDVYEGLLAGIVLAEVELERADIIVPIPAWIGQEVTGMPEYKKINMIRARSSFPSSP